MFRVGQTARLQEPLDVFDAVARAEKRSFHSVRIGARRIAVPARLPRACSFRTCALLSQIPMPNRQRDPNGAARVTGCRLNPEIFEWALSQQTTIRHAIERDAARHA